MKPVASHFMNNRTVAPFLTYGGVYYTELAQSQQYELKIH